MKTLLRILAIVLALIVLAVVVDFAALRGRTPAIRGDRSIASLEKIRLGGVEQWILIRGRDRTKPVLLFLHGGPGMPAMFLAHACERALERDFVVVNWDRRGAGRSYAAGRDSTGLSVSRALEDTWELTRLLRARFGQPRIDLAAHSWGTYLGLLAARGHPEYYRLYVGMGQLAGTREQADSLRRALLERAAAATRDPEVLARLADTSRAIREDDVFRYGGELYAAHSFLPILLTGLLAPEYTFHDAMNVKRGADRVGRLMVYDVQPKPLEGEITKLDVPVFFFLGRHDLNTPSPLAAGYLQRLDAPLKRLVWFDRSAHFPFLEEPERFHTAMMQADREAESFWRASGLNGRDRPVPPRASENQKMPAGHSESR